jgi:hypothetical protein
MDIKVSEPVATFFMDQCIGETSGHMAMIPNNPVLDGLITAHGVKNKKDFAAFLIDVSNQLMKGQPF